MPQTLLHCTPPPPQAPTWCCPSYFCWSPLQSTNLVTEVIMLTSGIFNGENSSANWGGGVLALSPKKQERKLRAGCHFCVKEQPDLWRRWEEWRGSRNWEEPCRCSTSAVLTPGSRRRLVHYILSIYFLRNGWQRLQLMKLSNCPSRFSVGIILLNPFLMKARRLPYYAPI